MTSLASVYERVGDARREFRCCDTVFVARATGVRADAAVAAGRDAADPLEDQLNAFEAASAVGRLNREGGSRTDTSPDRPSGSRILRPDRRGVRHPPETGRTRRQGVPAR